MQFCNSRLGMVPVRKPFIQSTQLFCALHLSKWFVSLAFMGMCVCSNSSPFGTVVRKNGSEGLGTVSDPTRAATLLKPLLRLVSSTILLSVRRTSQMWTMNDIVFELLEPLAYRAVHILSIIHCQLSVSDVRATHCDLAIYLKVESSVN